ncbi:MAG: 50S ribosomal protein L10 [Actinomycetota bacterium]
MPRPDKQQAVKEIAERFSSVGAALLTEYRGLSVGEMAEVRTALRQAEADYRVIKNTLARIALRDVGLEELVAMLEGPTAVAFCRGDAVEAAKALDDASRKFPVLVIKGGVLNGRIVSADQARELARLESREVQLAKIAMLANSPLQQTVNAFAALLRDLGSMLAQVLQEKEAAEPEPEAAEPEPEAAEPEPEAAEPEPEAAEPEPEAAGPEPEAAGAEVPTEASAEETETPDESEAGQQETEPAAEEESKEE